MNSIIKTTSFVIFVLFLLALTCILYKAASVDYGAEIPNEQSCAAKRQFELSMHFNTVDSGNLKAIFPYQAYIDSADLCSISSISRDVFFTDSLLGKRQPALVRETFISALTEKLEEKINPSLSGYNLDSLILMVQWASKFNYYKDIDSTNARLYKIIYRHWMGLISNKISELYLQRPSIKYDFKFKYIVTSLKSKNYLPAIGNTKGEKIVNYFIDQQYAYLFHRFWNGTTWVFKTLICLIGILVFYGFFCILKVHVLK